LIQINPPQSESRIVFVDLEKARAMTKPITNKAEVALEYPDKLYIGTFAHTARFDAHIDQTGISLTLELPGPVEQRKSVRMHFHHALFADILRDLAKTAAALLPDDLTHRDSLRDSAKALYVGTKERLAGKTRVIGRVIFRSYEPLCFPHLQNTSRLFAN
jgi:hypothetical protein